MKCPGQDMQYWTEGAIFEEACPECGAPVEFYKDDTSRKCRKCGCRFVNPKLDFGCASYCQYAEQCLGTLPEEFVGQMDNLLKDKVAVEMKRYYKTDFKRISHATKVARHAEKIGKSEGGNLAVILCAAYLNGIGYDEAEKKFNRVESEKIQEESAVIARSILGRLGAKEQILTEVCDIIGPVNGSSREQSCEYRVVADADRIVNLLEQHKAAPFDPEELAGIIENDCLLDSSRDEAIATFMQLGVL